MNAGDYGERREGLPLCLYTRACLAFFLRLRKWLLCIVNGRGLIGFHGTSIRYGSLSLSLVGEREMVRRGTERLVLLFLYVYSS